MVCNNKILISYIRIGSGSGYNNSGEIMTMYVDISISCIEIHSFIPHFLL